MPATPGELALLAQLQKLSTGQASGSFGPGQALALLVGFVKLRDRVDELAGTGQSPGAVAALAEAVADLQGAASGLADKVDALEQWKAGIEGRVNDLEARLPPPPTV